MLGTILFFTALASLLSLFLVGILLLSKKLIHSISFSLVSFAAGALLATALLDTMPEAVESSKSAYLFVTLSMAGFFLIERLFISLHHHDDEETETLRIPIPFLIFGDALHNFIDGASIASTFLISFPVGIVTSIAVFVHEIPHELGDFGILLHKKWGRGKVLWFNFLTGLAALAGAIGAFYLGSTFHNLLPVLLSIATGNFLYLSTADLVPEIHHKSEKKADAFTHTAFFFLGIFLMILLTQIISG